MSVTRRDLLRNASALFVAGIGLEPAIAQQLHQQVRREQASAPGYSLKFFKHHEFQTLQRLAELIIPADETGPSARDAGAAEFIDLLCSRNEELGQIFTAGLLWLDATMQDRFGSIFLKASEENQRQMLDLLAYRKNHTPDLRPGVHFWRWLRRLVVDAYYTSPEGIKAIGYMGNQAVSEFSVPKEAIDYALKRSPFQEA